MHIKPLEEGDLAAISQIYINNWRENYKNILPGDFLAAMDERKEIKKWRSYHQSPGQSILVAIDDEVLGFAAYRPDYDFQDCLHLDYLHIASAHQGKGVGKSLLFAVGCYAWYSGYDKMSIYHIIGNHRANAIYRHLGAVHCGEFIDDFQGASAPSVKLIWDNLDWARPARTLKKD